MLCHVRIARSEYVSSPILTNFITSKLTNYLLVQEDPDKDVSRLHNHLVARIPWNNSKTYRDNLKREFPNLHGQGDYGSLKQCDEIMYHYISKGKGPDFDTQGPNVICTSFDDEQIRQFHTAYWAYKTQFPELLPVKVQLDQNDPPQPKKKRAKQFTEKIRDELVSVNPDKTWDIRDETDRHILIKFLDSKLGSLAKNFDRVVYVRMFNGLVLGLPKNFETQEYHTNKHEQWVVESCT